MPTAPSDVNPHQQATPRPWRVERRHSADVRIAADNCTICMMANWLPAELAERDANAALIIEAVNAHDTLRAENAGLREALEFYRDQWFQNADGDLSEAHLTRTWLEPTEELWTDAGRKAANVLATNALKDPQP